MKTLNTIYHGSDDSATAENEKRQKKFDAAVKPFLEEVRTKYPDMAPHTQLLYAAKQAMEAGKLKEEDITRMDVSTGKAESLSDVPKRKMLSESEKPEVRQRIWNIFLSDYVVVAKAKKPSAPEHEQYASAVTAAEKDGRLREGFCLHCSKFFVNHTGRVRCCTNCGMHLEFLKNPPSKQSSEVITLSESKSPPHHEASGLNVSKLKADAISRNPNSAGEEFRKSVCEALGESYGASHSKSIDGRIKG